MNTSSASGRLSCFFSYPYSDDISGWMWRVGQRVAKEFNMAAVTGSGDGDYLVDGIVDRLSKAFMVVAETTVPNWWVAFEVLQALAERFTILLYLDHNVPGRTSANGPFPLDPTRVRTPYKLPFAPDGETQLENLLRTKIKHYLGQAEEYVRGNNERLLQGERERMAALRNPIDPTLVLHERSEETTRLDTTPERLFGDWLSPSAKAKQIAIIGYPGYGKTVLLRRFAVHLLRRISAPSDASTLTPLCLSLRAADLVPGTITADAVLALFSAKLAGAPKEPNAATLPPRIEVGLLAAYQQAHLLYILLDGLDELVVPQPTESDPLTRTLRQLGDRGVNLIVTCRRNLWLQRLQSQLPDFQVIELMPIPPSKLGPLLPPGAPRGPGPSGSAPGGASNGFYSWATTPLGLHFLNELHEAGKSLSGIKKRSDLFAHWAGWLVERGLRKPGGDDRLLRFFGELAIWLLRERVSSITGEQIQQVASDCKVEVDPDLLEGTLFQTAQPQSGETKQYEFFHLSAQEFFIARSLSSEFLATVKAGPQGWERDPGAGNLGQVRTDYLQASMFGFLEELLAEDVSFTAALHRLLASREFRGEKHRADASKVAIQRNLVEYVGMTCRGGNDAEVVDALVAIVEAETLTEEVRFNAARALERIHPGAPRPYFDYISDWHEKSWGQRFVDAKVDKEAPYTIQGQGRKDVRAARHFHFSPNDPGSLPEMPLWRRVSGKLVDQLEQLIARPDARFLRINCSMALIRWCHPDDARRLTTLRERAESKGQTETAINLGFVEKYRTTPA